MSDDNQTKTRAPRKTNTVNVAALESCRKRLDLSNGEFSRELGYSDHAYNDWVRKGRAPASAALAAECLVRRQSNGGADTVLLVKVVKGVARVTVVQDSHEMSMDGKRYIMIPVESAS